MTDMAPQMTAATQVDLSGYTVSLQRHRLLWSWAATSPDDERLPSGGVYSLRADAEQDALEAIEAHARDALEDVVLSGEELRNRVQGNNQ